MKLAVVYWYYILHCFHYHVVDGRIGYSKKRIENDTKNFVRSISNQINSTIRRIQQQQQFMNNTNNNEEDYFPVIIGMLDDSDSILTKIRSRISNDLRLKKFKRIKAMSAVLSRSEFDALQSDPDILYLEDDPLVYPDSTEQSSISSNEASLYGLRMVQAFAPILTQQQNLTAANTISSACNDPTSFKIGIIDSGLAIDHPDIPCLPRDDEDTNCIGMEFGIDEGDGVWYNPISKSHGTHVAGTIGARGLNNDGIQGIINDGNICFIVGRVFGESGGGTRMSNIFEAIEWVADQGADIINMSLGVDRYHASGDALMKAIHDDGALLVAASGNSGTEELHYPANYLNVLSVGAVDAKREHASFSQYNAGVDIVGPGVDILSTQPLSAGGAIFVSNGNISSPAMYFEYSTQIDESISGVLVLCPNYGSEQCPGNGGHICLIERGLVTFETKTLNCQLGGGIATIIYNNEAGTIEGTLSNTTDTIIPSLQISTYDGERFVKHALETTVTIAKKMGYGYLSGTSMAVPHVTGVIAKIWRLCPTCNNQHIERCLLNTTMDLGDPGKDTLYGHGLVQALPAYRCLVDTIQCC